MSFLHGVEILETTPARPITVVKSGVIALVGTAPKGPMQTLTVVQSENDIASFGKELHGFTIPQALRAIYDQGPNATVVVVNVFDPAVNNTTITGTLLNVDQSTRTAQTTQQPINEVLLQDHTGTTTLVKGTDYTIDDFGKITFLTYNNFTVASGVLATYHYADFAGINAASIVGTNTSGVRTGLQLFDLCYNTFGFKPKIIIAPEHSQLTTVRDAMALKAAKYRAQYLLDVADGTSYATMLTSRGMGGAFFTSDTRAIGLYPNVKVMNTNSGVVETRARSQYVAGIMANNDADLNKGYWTSPSNTVIKGIVGDEIILTFDIQDATCEANTLNSLGIVTSANAYGIGLLNWGNRNLSYPSNTSVESFINVRRTFDVLEESIALSMFQFLDLSNITQGSIDRIKDNVNEFIDILIGRGALLPGTVLTYNSARNPPAQLATGQVVFTLSGLSPLPMERITFEVNFDISLLNFNS